jgi:hypothetical protein
MFRKPFRLLMCILFSIAILAACAKTTEIVTMPPPPTQTPTPPSIYTPIATATSIPTSTPSSVLQKVKLNCTQLETFAKCWDETLSIEFDYPISWGEIEALLRPGGSTGFRYDYFFGGRTIGEAEPLLAGGRSKDFTEGRGGMPTDFSGFTSSVDRCTEVSDLYSICQIIKPDVIWMIRFPDSEDFCYFIDADVVSQIRWQPVVRIDVNLPRNPTIQGFVFEAPFLSDQLLEQLDSDLLPLLGLGSESSSRNCDPSNRQMFDSQVQCYFERVKNKELDDRTLENLDELLHLANSITFQRTEVITYKVLAGDTIFEIANKFNLNPETILWSNYETLVDNYIVLQPGIELNILPVDGVYYKWKEGDDLNAVASKLGVRPEDIIDWPGNHLNLETLDDLFQPNIEPGTMLVIQSGRLEFASWSSPSSVHAPTVFAQTGSEPFYETLFAIPVGEGSLQYFGGDQPDSEINGPNAIAVLTDGSFVIADLVGNRLWRYDSTGQLLKSIDLYSIGIEQVTDLRSTNTELFMLEIRNERYRVNRLSFDGELIASYDIPVGFHIENGLTGITVDCEGAVLLEIAGGSDHYRLVDPQGNLYPSIVKTDYYCNGKPYRGLNSGPGTIPKFIAGSNSLETQLTTGLGGFNLLAVLNDGSLFMIRDDVVNDRVIQVDQTVHYINAGGVQQGVARVPLAQYYYSIMRNLAVGLDDNVYAILPQPDSVHIIRLNFYKSLEPLIPEAVEPLITISTTNP